MGGRDSVLKQQLHSSFHKLVGVLPALVEAGDHSLDNNKVKIMISI